MTLILGSRLLLLFDREFGPGPVSLVVAGQRVGRSEKRCEYVRVRLAPPSLAPHIFGSLAPDRTCLGVNPYKLANSRYRLAACFFSSWLFSISKRILSISFR